MPRVNLDLKDKKILLAMDMNARKTDTQIAKEVGLSKQITNYRIKRLEKKKIIQGYYPVIDHTKLGLKLYRIALKFENVTKEKEKELVEYLKKEASWISSVLGEWDISMGSYFKDEYEYMKFWNTFYEKYGTYVEKNWVSLMTTFWNFERSFILPEKKNRDKKFVLGENPSEVKIDKVDENIMKELTKNARQTTLDIAKKVKQTERVVRYRLKRLEKEKVILGYRPFLNTNLLGLKFFKIYIQLKSVLKKDINKIRTYIRMNPNVAYSTEALGGYDFELEGNFKDSQELYEFITNLKEKFPKYIRDVYHIEYMKEYKITYYPS
jgi:DNA-binding Lrp family transcriptional regulator